MSHNNDKKTDKAPVVKFKTPKHFRLSFYNENTLNRVWSVGMTRQRLITYIVVSVAAVFFLGVSLISFTPLRNLLPGYLRSADREEYIIASSKADSLIRTLDATQIYIDNIQAIIEGRVQTDSIRPQARPATLPDNIDSLLNPSPAERRFVDAYSAREGVNFEIPVEMEKDAPNFIPPVADAIVSPGSGREKLRFDLADGKTTVFAIAKGTIVDCFKNPDQLFTVIIQHPDGYLSRYSGLSRIFHDRGGRLEAGARLGIVADKSPHQFTFELFRNGINLDPRRLIHF